MAKEEKKVDKDHEVWRENRKLWRGQITVVPVVLRAIIGALIVVVKLSLLEPYPSFPPRKLR